MKYNSINVNKSLMRVSIVIPAYNEERHIKACLESIAAQTVRPFEVIVVDNNSTDRTAKIARSFPFVTLLKESRQGVVYARDAGFNAARGEVIGRIDADSIISPDWVECVQSLFADSSIDAASGQVSYRGIALPHVFDAADRVVRRYLSQRMGELGEQFLYGVNMAIRREAWQVVRTRVCHERTLHEDLDLAAHLSKCGKNVVFDMSMRASISPRQAGAGIRDFSRYVWSSPRVYKLHGMKSLRYAYYVAVFVQLFYVPINLLYKGYDPAAQRFSLGYALNNTTSARVSPISESL